jgi:hypothetical protein
VNISILVAVNDSPSTRETLDFLCNLPFCPENVELTLVHVFRKPSGGEALMGEKYMKEQPERYLNILKDARRKLIEKGFTPEKVVYRLINEPYPTVAEGIIDQYNKGRYHMVVVGRKRMSKAEEFVLGDPSIKLIRALEGTSVLIVKGK